MSRRRVGWAGAASKGGRIRRERARTAPEGHRPGL